MQALDEIPQTKDALLILVSDYIRICAPRLEELEELSLPPRYTVPELLDSISVNIHDRCALPLLKGSPEALETASVAHPEKSQQNVRETPSTNLTS
ncbi:ion transmembrane transport [Desmophyllum pertusum]|uniref:Ion transmembrane transport n=1 Tax=Desmophyllum pertusum TaxID=174260 RepID=A0A9W9YTU1_9CNID|nr:ion transmembrane transport [Desmophyllum pertusum]